MYQCCMSAAHFILIPISVGTVITDCHCHDESICDGTTIVDEKLCRAFHRGAGKKPTVVFIYINIYKHANCSFRIWLPEGQCLNYK